MSTVEVHVVTPQREVWSGLAEMVIARSTEGELGIMNGHEPLLIQLAAPGRLRLQQSEGPEIVFEVDGGFLHATSGPEGTRVDVMATSAELVAPQKPVAPGTGH
jgi:F-type H+-transporting ATPase subunit epsilon